MEKESGRAFFVQLSFEEIQLPPSTDILILGKKCPQGKIAVSKSLELLAPTEFETIDIENEMVSVIFINKKLLKKLSKEIIVNVLDEKVLPHISASEILKVDFNVNISYDSIKGEL